MLDKTTIFAYDNSGNITSRVEYKYSLADTLNFKTAILTNMNMRQIAGAALFSGGAIALGIIDVSFIIDLIK